MPENKEQTLTGCPERPEFTLVILAGGASSRMGRDKADLPLFGKTFLELQIEKGRHLGAREILISGYRGLHCEERVIPDRIQGQGPLGGLESCLREAKSRKCLVLGVDTPLVPERELEQLLKAAEQEKEKRVTLLCHGGKEESLIAVYDTELYREMEHCLKEGKRSVFRFLNEIGYACYHAEAENAVFRNINDPKSYETVKL